MKDPFADLGPPLGSWDLCHGSECGCAHCGLLGRRLFVLERQAETARFAAAFVFVVALIVGSVAYEVGRTRGAFEAFARAEELARERR